MMHSSMQSIFHPPNQQQISTIYYDSPLILKSKFTQHQSNQPTDQILMAMNNSHIFIFEVKQDVQCQNHKHVIPQLCTRLEFDLKFQILRDQWKDQLTPGKPIGISFEKSNCHTITFFSNVETIVDEWRLKLQERINERGFHKLFKAKKKIGKGAFATVYLAERLADKKLVAVKAFSKQKQYSGDKGKDSLINQITLMRKLKNHSSIINLEAVFETQNSIYVILENLEGGQLHEKIKMGVKFSLYDTIKIMKSILQGLAFMDSKRIIHRDLKPQNLLFRSKNSYDIVIADYGLATWAEQPNYLFVRCGTPGFVAPQIINIKDMTTHSDPISDVFSVGLIFHFLLLGRSVFKGTKYAQILSQNRACDYKLVGSDYSELDPAAYDLLCRMLEVNPKSRIRAQQALNHKLFQQSMDIQGQEVEMKFNECLSFIKQTKISSIYESPVISGKGKENISSAQTNMKTPKTPLEIKKKRESITLNNTILTSRINHEGNNA